MYFPAIYVLVACYLIGFPVCVSAQWSVPDAGVIHTEIADVFSLNDPQPDEQKRIAKELLDSLYASGISEGDDRSKSTMSGAVMFDQMIEIFRLASVSLNDYLDQCDRLAWQELPFAQPVVLPTIPLDISVEAGRTNYTFGTLRYYLAQRLVQARLFEEAIIVFEDITPENSVDPAGVLMGKAVVFHHFSDREAGLAALNAFRTFTEQPFPEQVLSDQPLSGRALSGLAISRRADSSQTTPTLLHQGSIPRRLFELAKLLQFDWEQQSQAGETEQIARQMDNVRRRLGQGRTDEETQNAEEDILQSLEGLIERLTEQSQQQSRLAQQSAHPNSPPEDALPQSPLRGPGGVIRRDFFLGDHWGDLPPRDREEALLRLDRDFPSHYRDIIELYFREMAR